MADATWLNKRRHWLPNLPCRPTDSFLHYRQNVLVVEAIEPFERRQGNLPVEPLPQTLTFTLSHQRVVAVPRIPELCQVLRVVLEFLLKTNRRVLFTSPSPGVFIFNG